MSVPVTSAFLALLLLFPQAGAKNKKKQVLPDFVLKAQTVAVVIRPDAGEPVTNPLANRTARDNVKNAMTKWGRFRLVTDAQTADLIVAVRKGHASGPAIGNSPADDQPIIYQPSGGDVLGAGQHGRSPDLTNPGLGRNPADRGPHITDEMGPSEDSFEVYMGGGDFPLDAPPIWRYMARGALNTPQVTAVEQFKNAINQSEQHRQQKP
jgi:hypothetical protein